MQRGGVTDASAVSDAVPEWLDGSVDTKPIVHARGDTLIGVAQAAVHALKFLLASGVRLPH